MTCTSRSALAIYLCAIAAGCRPSDSGTAAAETGPVWLEDQAPSRGVDFVYQPGPEGRYLMPEIMGGGAARTMMAQGFDLALLLNAILYWGCALYGLPRLIKLVSGKSAVSEG